MRILSGYQAVRGLSIKRPVVTIGNFDGLHLGHQEIIRRLVAFARQCSGTPTVYTFRPHPREVLAPEPPAGDKNPTYPLLATYAEKLQLFQELGVEIVIEEPFNTSFFSLNAESFFTDILKGVLNIHALFVGHDFAFGKKREGQLEMLSQLSKQRALPFFIVPAVKLNGQVLSSSLIRSCLKKGELEQARQFLARPFSYSGPVQRGERRGRLLAYPTLNIALPDKILLPLGVYLTKVRLPDLGPELGLSLTNIGRRPTFFSSNAPVVIETHCLNYPTLQARKEHYGLLLEIYFYRYLRMEKKFSSQEALIEQLGSDLAQAQDLFAQGFGLGL